MTIVLVGTETKRRKHIDWEIYSSMYDGAVNKKSGILVITLPTTLMAVSTFSIARAVGEESLPRHQRHGHRSTLGLEYERRYPYMPDRIIDNLLEPEAKISVAPWNRINETTLKFLIDVAFKDRARCVYDLSRPMRRANS